MSINDLRIKNLEKEIEHLRKYQEKWGKLIRWLRNQELLSRDDVLDKIWGLEYNAEVQEEDNPTA